MRSCLPDTTVLVVDRISGRGNAMCQAFLGEPGGLQVFLSQGSNSGQDFRRVDGLDGLDGPDRAKLILCLVHNKPLEQDVAKQLTGSAETKFFVSYSGSGKQDHDTDEFIHRPIRGSKDALAPAEARELVSWALGETGNEPSCFSPSRWPRSLVGVYLGLVAGTRGVDILDSVAKHIDNAKEEERQIVTDCSRDTSSLRWDEFDRDAPENNREQVAVLRARISELAGDDEANFFTPWSIDCEGTRLCQLVRHELVDKILDKDHEQAWHRFEQPESAWPELQVRVTNARCFAEDLLDHFTPSHLIDDCRVLTDGPVQSHQEVGRALHTAYLEHSEMFSLQEQLTVSVRELATSVGKFRDLAQSGNRVDEPARIELWEDVKRFAVKLRDSLARTPRGVVLP